MEPQIFSAPWTVLPFVLLTLEKKNEHYDFFSSSEEKLDHFLPSTPPALLPCNNDALNHIGGSFEQVYSFDLNEVILMTLRLEKLSTEPAVQ